MVDDILDLPPELGYEIYKHCGKSDLINFACCSRTHYESIKYLLFKNIRMPWKIVETKTFSSEELENFKFASSLYFSDYDLSSIFNKIVWDSISCNYQEILLHTDPDILSCLKLESIIINEDNSMTILVPNNLKEISLKKCYGISLADWLYIGSLTCLKTLTINQCNFDDSGMENLVHCTTIHTLNVIRCSDITEKSLEYLVNVVTLRKLTINGCESISPNGYFHLSNLANIHELILLDAHIAVHSLISFNKLKCLKTLMVQCATGNSMNITNESFSYANLSLLEKLCINSGFVVDENLHELTNLHHLKHLDVSSNSTLSDVGFFEVCKLTAITELVVSSCENLTDDGLTHIKNLQCLKLLDISYCSNLTDECMNHIKEACSLEILCSGYNRISDQGIDYISTLKSLRCFDISGCSDVTDIGMFFMGYSNRSIERLIMTGCTDITDVGLEYVKHLTLKQLDISLDLYRMQGRCMKIDDVALSHVSLISTLRHLNISCCHYITNEGLSHVSKLDLLDTLDVSRCPKVNDTGLAYLSEMTILRNVNVSMCLGITDIGIGYLCKIRSVKFIDLHGCTQVTNVWPTKYPYKVFKFRCFKAR